MTGDQDLRVRLAAFEFLAERTRLHGDVLPARVLMHEFTFEGERIPLKGQQGIFKPAKLDLPLSITTAAVEAGRERPYDDAFAPGGDAILYRYRGTDPRHHENVGLRLAMERRRPLIYLHGVVPGEYAAAWPVYVVGDDPASLRFRVSVDDASYVGPQVLEVSEGAEARRAYITVSTRRRLHQDAFRARVLRAYRERCALCQLRHERLLDAAHIVPDSDERGEPTVDNGLALCKLHHAAFDQDLLGIRPDFVVELRPEVLEEEDGPMLEHGLQGFHDQKLLLPRRPEDRPRADRLEIRYRRFRDARVA
jgi:putative restriction endonuclease